MLEVLFEDMKSIFGSLFRSAFVAISIFLTTMIYGEDINLQFSYEIPNEVYEYEAGDTVEFTIKCENTGKAFETVHWHSSGPWVSATVSHKNENGDN